MAELVDVIGALVRGWPTPVWDEARSTGYWDAAERSGLAPEAFLAAITGFEGKPFAPQPAELVGAARAAANRLAAEANQQAAERARASAQPTWRPVLDLPCDACGGQLALDAHPPMLWCRSCRAVQVQEWIVEEGKAARPRTQLTSEEVRRLRLGEHEVIGGPELLRVKIAELRARPQPEPIPGWRRAGALVAATRIPEAPPKPWDDPGPLDEGGDL